MFDEQCYSWAVIDRCNECANALEKKIPPNDPIFQRLTKIKEAAAKADQLQLKINSCQAQVITQVSNTVEKRGLAMEFLLFSILAAALIVAWFNCSYITIGVTVVACLMKAASWLIPHPCKTLIRHSVAPKAAGEKLPVRFKDIIESVRVIEESMGMACAHLLSLAPRPPKCQSEVLLAHALTEQWISMSGIHLSIRAGRKAMEAVAKSFLSAPFALNKRLPQAATETSDQDDTKTTADSC